MSFGIRFDLIKQIIPGVKKIYEYRELLMIYFETTFGLRLT
jgi:hypothetical protein